MKNRTQQMLLNVMSFLLVISCLSCGSSNMMAGGGIGGSGGPITGFGSIIVNGTEYDTSDAVIIIDGVEVGIGDDAVLNHLDLGKYVTVIGGGSEDAGDAYADEVIYNRDMEGPVESVYDIDERTRELVVMGQTVMVNAVTHLKDVSFDLIAPNDVLEISGMRDDLGILWATYLEKTGEFVPGIAAEVTGIVANLDTANQTFDINDLSVDYSQADITSLPDAMLTQGMRVEVQGSLESVGGNIMAEIIEPADELDISDADGFEIMGFVTEGLSGLVFEVGYQTVEIDEPVEFVDGDLEDIVPGVKLEAEGALEDGVLYAWEIEFWKPDQIELQGIVTEALSASEFYIGTQLVQTEDATVFEDGTPEDIEAGINLEIKGRMIDGFLVADKVSFELE